MWGLKHNNITRILSFLLIIITMKKNSSVHSPSHLAFTIRGTVVEYLTNHIPKFLQYLMFLEKVHLFFNHWFNSIHTSCNLAFIIVYSHRILESDYWILCSCISHLVVCVVSSLTFLLMQPWRFSLGISLLINFFFFYFTNIYTMY